MEKARWNLKGANTAKRDGIVQENRFEEWIAGGWAGLEHQAQTLRETACDERVDGADARSE